MSSLLALTSATTNASICVWRCKTPKATSVPVDLPYMKEIWRRQFETKFDKILSLGVFGHVGHLTPAFQKLASFLKDKSRVFIHIITVRTPNNISSAFTHKYIFPLNRYWKYDVPATTKTSKP